VGRDARILPLIWGKREAIYFYGDIWTARIALIGFDKFVFTRNRKVGARAIRDDAVSRNDLVATMATPAPDPRCYVQVCKKF
jgi:hypothetical protein